MSSPVCPCLYNVAIRWTVIRVPSIRIRPPQVPGVLTSMLSSTTDMTATPQENQRFLSYYTMPPAPHPATSATRRGGTDRAGWHVPEALRRAWLLTRRAEATPIEDSGRATRPRARGGPPLLASAAEGTRRIAPPG